MHLVRYRSTTCTVLYFYLLVCSRCRPPLSQLTSLQLLSHTILVNPSHPSGAGNAVTAIPCLGPPVYDSPVLVAPHHLTSYLLAQPHSSTISRSSFTFYISLHLTSLCHRLLPTSELNIHDEHRCCRRHPRLHPGLLSHRRRRFSHLQS
jgi:hypothetical protein